MLKLFIQKNAEMHFCTPTFIIEPVKVMDLDGDVPMVMVKADVKDMVKISSYKLLSKKIYKGKKYL